MTFSEKTLINAQKENNNMNLTARGKLEYYCFIRP